MKKAIMLRGISVALTLTVRGTARNVTTLSVGCNPKEKGPAVAGEAKMYVRGVENSPQRTTSGSALQGDFRRMLDYALQYAARSWRVFPVHSTVSGTCSCGRDCGKDASKHPSIKSWQTRATTDPATIEAWWRKWPTANIGIATGSGLVVLDLDGHAEIQTFKRIASPHGGLPPTLVARTARGLHLYLAGDWPTTKKVPDKNGLLVRGTGGFVVAPPSLHATGVRYSWAKDLPAAPMPDWFRAWLQTAENPQSNGLAGLSPLAHLTGELPDYIKNKTKALDNQSSTVTASVAQALRDPWSPAIEARVQSALAAMPASCGRDDWLKVGMALHGCDWVRPDGTDAGFDLWLGWSSTGGDKFQGLHDLETRWKSFGKRGGVGLGTLFHMAEQAGWLGGPAPVTSPFPFEAFAAGQALNGPVLKSNGHHVDLPPELTAEGPAPLITLNNSYSVIGDVGGKCLVLGWVPSKVDEAVRLPSFQTFKSFADRYSNRRAEVMERGKDGEPLEKKFHPLGAYWLKWTGRQTFEGIDLVPGRETVLPGNVLNLWQGFAMKPAPGEWSRMKRHIVEVLAGGDVEAARYIVNWAAWAVQNPGKRAEAALVLRGGKGAGKGLFARALRHIFGQHGLQIYNPKHLVGAFNGHLRNCLLLYADEAFWAGDKQGESVLKGLITEPTIPIEHKGLDVEQWFNRIHLLMTANAEWVVPASHDERRYCVLDVTNEFAGKRDYFDPIYAELESGGYAAMLHDLLALDLKGWHPREIVKTEALRLQKERSMSPLHEWYESLLQDGVLPYVGRETPDICAAGVLLEHARAQGGRLKDTNATALGRFLRDSGVVKIHRATGNVWRFPPLQEVRGKWEARFSGWRWEATFEGWQVRG